MPSLLALGHSDEGDRAVMDCAIIYALVDEHCSDPIERYRYVGQTRLDPAKRLHRHWLTARAGAKEHRAMWMRAMEEYEREIGVEVLDMVAPHEADEAERRHIKRLRLAGADLTNRTDGGRGRRGWIVTEETRRRMSEAARRRVVAPETRAKMAAAIRSSEKHRAHLNRLHQLQREKPWSKRKK